MLEELLKFINQAKENIDKDRDKTIELTNRLATNEQKNGTNTGTAIK